MAEVGLIASVLGIAGAGAKLTVTLYTFAETVSSADKSINDVAKDVAITSAVLKELAVVIEEDQKAKITKDDALKTASETVHGCSDVFNEIETVIGKSMSNIKGGKGKAALEKLKWPFREPKMRLLRSNLEKRKSDLLLLLSVLSYARDIAINQVNQQGKIERRLQIRELIRSNAELKITHEQLLEVFEPTTRPPELGDGKKEGSAALNEDGKARSIVSGQEQTISLTTQEPVEPSAASALVPKQFFLNLAAENTEPLKTGIDDPGIRSKTIPSSAGHPGPTSVSPAQESGNLSLVPYLGPRSDPVRRSPVNVPGPTSGASEEPGPKSPSMHSSASSSTPDLALCIKWATFLLLQIESTQKAIDLVGSWTLDSLRDNYKRTRSTLDESLGLVIDFAEEVDPGVSCYRRPYCCPSQRVRSAPMSRYNPSAGMYPGKEESSLAWSEELERPYYEVDQREVDEDPHLVQPKVAETAVVDELLELWTTVVDPSEDAVSSS